MIIVADEMIPFVRTYFGDSHDVILKDGRAISNKDLQDADILLVRAVTSVDAALLKNTKVKWVASTTSGSDHIDIPFLKAAGIKLFIAQGCNAQAVAEYVINVIACAQHKQILGNQSLRVGIIGLGQIGQRVQKLLQAMNITVVQNDPLRAQQEKAFTSTPLAEFSDLDVVTLHVPLTFVGDFPTHHLLQKNFFQQQKVGALLINTSRGAVINNKDLPIYGQHLQWCLDVWENEPDIDLSLMNDCLFATPHMAGYSMQSKQRGMQMVYHYFVDQGVLQPASTLQLPNKSFDFNEATLSWQEVLLNLFNPSTVTQQMKQTMPLNFDAMRKTFFDRCEFAFAELNNLRFNTVQDEQMIQKLFNKSRHQALLD